MAFTALSQKHRLKSALISPSKVNYFQWAINLFPGFSFTGKDECYAKNEEDVASDLYEALQQFFTLFPDLRQNNDFFVSGESYAGKYVPAITFKIHTMNEATKDKKKLINLKVI